MTPIQQWIQIYLNQDNSNMQLTAHIKTRIYGQDIRLDFLGYDDNPYGYKIEEINWNRDNYSDFQNKLIDEYVWDNVEQYENIVNNQKHEL